MLDNKIQWCLEKARKELASGKKHRGLMKSHPDIAAAKSHLAKAEHNLLAAGYLEMGGFPDWAICAYFYTIYHCLLSILSKFGYESRNQECTIALIENLRNEERIHLDWDLIEQLKGGKPLSIIDMREDFQYGVSTSLSRDFLLGFKESGKKAIDQTKKELY